MTQFEAKVYKKTDEDIIGAEVIIEEENGESIEDIQILDKTQFEDLVDELNAKLDVIDETYVQFGSESSLVGENLDTILENSNNEIPINASTLNGLSSSSFSTNNHTHQKTNITDLYNYNLSASKYRVNAATNEATVITVKVTDMNDVAKNNVPIVIKKNGVAWVNGNTNSNGEFSATYTPANEEIVNFECGNQNIQCHAYYDTGWVTVTVDPDWRSTIENNASSNPLKIRRLGKVVSIKGKLTTKTGPFDSSQGIFVSTLDSKFKPSSDILLFNVSSGKYHHCVRIDSLGNLNVGERYGNSSVVDIPKNTVLYCYGSYLI